MQSECDAKDAALSRMRRKLAGMIADEPRLSAGGGTRGGGGGGGGEGAGGGGKAAGDPQVPITVTIGGAATGGRVTSPGPRRSGAAARDGGGGGGGGGEIARRAADRRARSASPRLSPARASPLSSGAASPDGSGGGGGGAAGDSMSDLLGGSDAHVPLPSPVSAGTSAALDAAVAAAAAGAESPAASVEGGGHAEAAADAAEARGKPPVVFVVRAHARVVCRAGKRRRGAQVESGLHINRSKSLAIAAKTEQFLAAKEERRCVRARGMPPCPSTAIYGSCDRRLWSESQQSSDLAVLPIRCAPLPSLRWSCAHVFCSRAL